MPAHDSSLANKAFGDLADKSLVVAYQSHQDALRFLSSMLGKPGGVALLLGPAGSGKSTILREQATWSSRDAAVAVVDGTGLTPRRLVSDMLSQFGVTMASRHDEDLLQQLSNHVTQQTRAGRVPVLMLDNAERATESALRLLNWLAALDVRGDFALRIVLAGKARLSETAASESLRSLARRHPATYSLNPLTAQETMIYVHTRFIAAGGERSEKIFPINVSEKLHELSGGWPGRLNERALEVLSRMAELKAARSVPRLIVTLDGDTMGEYELKEKQYVIGRTELADIVIEDTYVSKVHAMLQVYANAIVLVDLNSTNGVTVNSIVTEKTILKSNDIISIGRYRLKLENAPALNPELAEKVKASDTITMQNLEDLRRSRARRTIAALKHRTESM